MGCAPQQRLKSAGSRDPCTCVCSDTSHLCAKVYMSGPGGYARAIRLVSSSLQAPIERRTL